MGGRIALFFLSAPVALHLRTLVLHGLLFPRLSIRGRMGASRDPPLLVEFEAARETQGDESVAPARQRGCASISMSLVSFSLIRATLIEGFVVIATRSY